MFVGLLFQSLVQHRYLFFVEVGLSLFVFLVLFVELADFLLVLGELLDEFVLVFPQGFYFFVFVLQDFFNHRQLMLFFLKLKYAFSHLFVVASIFGGSVDGLGLGLVQFFL